LIALRFEVKEDGSGIDLEIPSLQKGLNSVGERYFYAANFLLILHVIFGSKIWVGTTKYVPLVLSFEHQAGNINIVF